VDFFEDNFSPNDYNDKCNFSDQCQDESVGYPSDEDGLENGCIEDASDYFEKSDEDTSDDDDGEGYNEPYSESNIEEHKNDYAPFKSFTHAILFLFSVQTRLSRTNFRNLIKILKHPKFSIQEIKKTSKWHVAPIPMDIETENDLSYRPLKVSYIMFYFMNLNFYISQGFPNSH
jgi:hypothetical protein